MAGRSTGLRKRKNKSQVDAGLHKESLDYHEGLSPNQVKIILAEFGLGDHINDFEQWLYGQTAPLVYRTDKKGEVKTIGGVYEYDLFRYIDWKRKGTIPAFD